MGFLKEYKEVNALLEAKEEIVFYAESRHYYQYYEKLVTDLRASGASICYITSDAKDPLLSQSNGLKVIYVKWLLGFLFSRIKAKVMIMTMPDLGNYLFKRSANVDQYIYVFHAAVSTHQQYSRTAFVNYDAIFCTGTYQVNEIRAAEKIYGTNQKELIHYGYPLLDAIKAKVKTGSKTILVAPSWFPGCIFDTCIKELLIELSALPYDVILRSHPEYEKRNRKDFLKVVELVKQYPNISIDTNPDVIERLCNTGTLITDRSGIALEFAFGVGKPVLFVDTALKEMNKQWREIGIEPVENSLRSQIGISVSPGQMNLLPQKLKELENFDLKPAEQLFFNSPQLGIDYILTFLRVSASSRKKNL